MTSHPHPIQSHQDEAYRLQQSERLTHVRYVLRRYISACYANNYLNDEQYRRLWEATEERQ